MVSITVRVHRDLNDPGWNALPGVGRDDAADLDARLRRFTRQLPFASAVIRTERWLSSLEDLHREQMGRLAAITVRVEGASEDQLAAGVDTLCRQEGLLWDRR